MEEVKKIIDRYPTLLFFVLTFVISWGAILLLFGAGAIPATDEIKEKIGITILLGPTLAGILLVITDEKAQGLTRIKSQLLRWSINVRWYFFALFLAPVTTLLSVYIFSFFSDNHQPVILTADDSSNLLLLGITGGIIVGLFEELGWTAFATPVLRRHFSIISTGIIIGVIWGAWHLILFWEEDSFSKNLAFFLLLARLFSWLPAFRILMVMVFEKTKSLLVIVLMHASLVLSLTILDPVVSGTELLVYILVRATVLWLVVAFFAYFRKF